MSNQPRYDASIHWNDVDHRWELHVPNRGAISTGQYLDHVHADAIDAKLVARHPNRVDLQLARDHLRRTSDRRTQPGPPPLATVTPTVVITALPDGRIGLGRAGEAPSAAFASREEAAEFAERLGYPIAPPDDPGLTVSPQTPRGPGPAPSAGEALDAAEDAGLHWGETDFVYGNGVPLSEREPTVEPTTEPAIKPGSGAAYEAYADQLEAMVETSPLPSATEAAALAMRHWSTANEAVDRVPRSRPATGSPNKGKTLGKTLRRK